MSDQISFGKKQSTFNNVLKNVGGSALNVGTTIGVGAGAGALVGKLASLTPYKPSEADLLGQYQDMFFKMTKSEKIPVYIKEAKGTILDICKNARRAHRKTVSIRHVQNQIDQNKSLLDELKNPKTGFFSNITKHNAKNESAAKEILKIAPEQNPTIKDLIDGLTSKIDSMTELLKKRKIPEMDDMLDNFVKEVSKNEKCKEIAEAGAKHLRKNAIIGVGIGIGIIGALIINILYTNGIIKFGKHTQNNQSSQNNLPSPIIGTSQG